MRKRSNAIVLTLFMVIGTVSLLGAYNTTAGAGQDISNTGHAITNSADRNK